MNKLCLTPAAATAEMEKCLHCTTKPCQKACPLGCSPCDFIAEAKKGNWLEAARLIREKNPFGETCGLICPERFCRKSCVRANIDCAIRIPLLQSYILQKADVLKNEPVAYPKFNGQTVAVIGTGPAASTAAFELMRNGFGVAFFEKENQVGGALNLIPKERLPREVFLKEWQRLFLNPRVETRFNVEIFDFEALLGKGFVGVIVASGEQQCRRLGIDGEDYTVSYMDYLRSPEVYATTGNVAVIGGGAVAVDCAVTARKNGAANVEMFVRRRLCDMRIEKTEYAELLDIKADITTMTRVCGILKRGDELTLRTLKTRFDAEGKLEDIPNTTIERPNFSLAVLALGGKKEENLCTDERVVYAGDCATGASTAVEAAASGREAALHLLQLLKI